MNRKRFAMRALWMLFVMLVAVVSLAAVLSLKYRDTCEMPLEPCRDCMQRHYSDGTPEDVCRD